MRRVMAVPYLSSTDKLVAIELLGRKNPDTGQCNPPIKMIGKDIGKGPRVVTTSISHLVATGLLQVTYRRGTAQYDFLRDWRDNQEAALSVAALVAPEKARKSQASTPHDAQHPAHHLRTGGSDAASCAPGTQNSARLAAQDPAYLKGEKLKGKKRKGCSRHQSVPDHLRARDAVDDKSSSSHSEGLRKDELFQKQRPLLLPISGDKPASPRRPVDCYRHSDAGLPPTDDVAPRSNRK
jgi:hypothetical protein